MKRVNFLNGHGRQFYVLPVIAIIWSYKYRFKIVLAWMCYEVSVGIGNKKSEADGS